MPRRRGERVSGSLIAVVIVATIACRLATPIGAQAPLPAALRSAHSAFLLNEAGDQRRFDDLARELAMWQRFVLVDARDTADVTITLGHGNTGNGAAVPIGAGWVTVEGEAFVLTVRDRASSEVLWNDKESIGLSSRGTIKKLVKRLRGRLGDARDESPQRVK